MQLWGMWCYPGAVRGPCRRPTPTIVPTAPMIAVDEEGNESVIYGAYIEHLSSNISKDYNLLHPLVFRIGLHPLKFSEKWWHKLAIFPTTEKQKK